MLTSEQYKDLKLEFYDLKRVTRDQVENIVNRYGLRGYAKGYITAILDHSSSGMEGRVFIIIDYLKSREFINTYVNE